MIDIFNIPSTIIRGWMSQDHTKDKQQATTSGNVDLDVCHYTASVGINEVKASYFDPLTTETSYKIGLPTLIGIKFI